MQFSKYVKAQSLEEAYVLLNESRKNKLLAGCTFLRMTNISINTAIDILPLGLDYIKQEGNDICIGATTSLREIETNELIQSHFGSVFKDTLVHLIGVQLRNHITIGAHVYSKFGFSDIIPLLLVLDASVVLFKNKTLKLADYMNLRITKDILTEIRIPVRNQRTVVYAMRNSYADYSILSTVVGKTSAGYRICVGARPAAAAFANNAMDYLNSKPYEIGDSEIAAKIAAEELIFGDNIRGSAEYRKTICENILKQSIEEVSLC